MTSVSFCIAATLVASCNHFDYGTNDGTAVLNKWCADFATYRCAFVTCRGESCDPRDRMHEQSCRLLCELLNVSNRFSYALTHPSSLYLSSLPTPFLSAYPRALWKRSGVVQEAFRKRSGVVQEAFRKRSEVVQEAFRKRSRTVQGRSGAPERFLNDF